MKYEKGDRVRIINKNSKYYGCLGTVHCYGAPTTSGKWILYLFVDGTMYKKKSTNTISKMFATNRNKCRKGYRKGEYYG